MCKIGEVHFEQLVNKAFSITNIINKVMQKAYYMLYYTSYNKM